MKLSHILLFMFAACSKPTPDTPADMTVYIGFTLIDGSGADPMPNAVMLVSGGRIVAAGSSAAISFPGGIQQVDLTGKFVTPGFINAHGHAGDVKGIEGGNYSRENVIDNLKLYARYGITTVVSLGGDREEAVSLRAVNDTTSTDRARLFIAGEVIQGTDPQSAAAIADSNHHMGVDFMKIRVDDNLGANPKMTEDVYRAVIARSHELGYRIPTHMYYLEDARKLLEAGSDLMAHSVRDLPVDASFIELIKAKNVCYCPTLTRELSTFVYGTTPEFFNDPFFTKEYDSAAILSLKDPTRQKQVRESKTGIKYREQLPVAMANLKTLSDNGVPIAFGTDSGVPTRFIGYFEHLEMNMMADAGLTPMKIIVSATKDAAKCMGLKDLGELANGKWADFIVLARDPTTEIQNMRSIEQVFIGGMNVAH
jgi:imidazolonepropionase-like amidohydrolase